MLDVLNSSLGLSTLGLVTLGAAATYYYISPPATTQLQPQPQPQPLHKRHNMPKGRKARASRHSRNATTTTTTTTTTTRQKMQPAPLNSDLGPALLSAARRGQLDLVRQLVLEQSADYDFVGGDGFTALHCAASRNEHTVCAFLLSVGANATLRCEEGNSVMDIAIQNKQAGLVRMFAKCSPASLESLLKMPRWASPDLLAMLVPEFDLEQVGHDNKTLLHVAMASGNVELVRHCVVKLRAADVLNQERFDGRSAFHFMLSLPYTPENSQIMRLIMQHGAQASNLGAALTSQYAADLVHVGVLTPAKHITCPHYSHQVPLIHWATQYNTALFDVLTKEFAPHQLALEALNANQQTVLAMAINHCAEVMAVKLLDLGANACLPGICATAVSRSFSVPFLERLLSLGVELETPGCESPLHYACRSSSLEMAQFLLGRGCSVNAQNTAGQTPLHHAVARNYADMVQLMLDNGAQLLADSMGETVLSLAKRNVAGSAQALPLLLAHPWTGTCSICECDGPLMPLNLCCHTFCEACLSHWIAAGVTDLASELRCPQSRCTKQLVFEDAQRFAKEPRIFELFDTRLAHRVCTEMEDFHWCPKCPAGGFSECSEVQCDGCQHQWCSACGSPPHNGAVCAIAESMRLTMEWKRGNSKKCPNCRIDTQHDGGCSHMRCPQCSYEWCWICNGKYIPGRYSFDMARDPCQS
jgi:ankyrin repeat protein